MEFALSVELNNALNNKNSAIINPITGRAWRPGDDVPTEWRDPRYLDPRDSRSYGLPPDNPARYFEQRHLLVGFALRFG
jgi:Ni/Co efflux regulator RcnB